MSFNRKGGPMEDAGDDACARSPIPAVWPPRLPGESDGAFARRAIDPGPLPVHLPDDPESCFVTLTDTKWIDIDCLHGREPVLPEATFWHNAAKRMAAACAGVIGRRGPLSAVPREDGTWRVLDGNATLEAARRYGWRRLPVRDRHPSGME